MAKRNFIVSAYLLMAISIVAQNAVIPKQGLEKITEAQLFNVMSVLASDSLGGRAPGELGGEKAAAYIEQKFQEVGLKPYFEGDYRQEFMLYVKSWDAVSLSMNTHTINGNDAIYYLGNVPVYNPEQKEFIYIGDGRDSIIENLDLTDKLVLVNLNPLTRSYSVLNKLEAKGVWGVVAFSSDDSTQFNRTVKFNTRMRQMVGLGKQKPSEVVKGLRSYIINNNQLPAITGFTASELAHSNFNADSLIVKNISIQSPIIFNEVATWNIVGVLKGTDLTAKPVVVSAHYDHVGQQPGGVCLGADDNASGVSAIIQVAGAYSGLKKKPVRDIIFVAFGAEELGLIGSEYFMTNFNKEDIFANINVDMIGRRDTLSKDNYVYILGTSNNPITHNLHQQANRQTVNLQLDYAYGNEVGSSSMMNRSDHYPFYKKGIPVIAFFSGLHGDYHTPRDTIEKIDFPLMTKRVQLIFATLYLVVNSDSLDN